MERFDMEVIAIYEDEDPDHTIVRLEMVDKDDVPAVMTWHYNLPRKDVLDEIGQVYSVSLRLNEGSL